MLSVFSGQPWYQIQYRQDELNITIVLLTYIIFSANENFNSQFVQDTEGNLKISPENVTLMNSCSLYRG